MSRFNVVCTDDSKYSKTAFDWYIENFHREGDTLGLLHVFQVTPIPEEGYSISAERVIDNYKMIIEKQVAEVDLLKAKYVSLCNEKKIKHEFIVVDSHSSPGFRICQTCKEKDADVIVMGQRGLGTVSRTVLGSVSDYVLHHANVTVVVVPTVKST